MRKSKGFIVAALAMALAGGAHATAPVVVAGNSTTKDAVLTQAKQVKPEFKRNKFGGFSGEGNPYKVKRKGQMNQRQLRKHLRQNPHLRKKYGK